MTDKKKELSPLLSACIGGLTGAIEISCTYPTEYTKTVMQLYPKENAKGALGVIKETARERGVFGLYRGYSALLMFSVPKNYVRFGTFQYVKENFFPEKSAKSSFMCGLAAGAAESTFVVTPQETLKTKLIHDKLSPEPKYRNVFHGISSIISEKGIGGMYKGYLATLMKQSSNQAVRFLVFDQSQQAMQNVIPIKVLCDLLCGGFAGFCSTMFNNPVDVIKTKMQGIDADKYKGFMDCGKQIMAKDGFVGFYSGIGPRLFRVVMDVALTFAIFNSLKRYVKDFIANKMY